MNNIDGGQVWYYYDAPEAAATQVQPPAVSQIPVLNGVPHEAEERPNPRRGGEDIDSKYLKIARAGGRKDLLQYSENKMKEDAKGYTRSEWFDHPDTQPDINVGKPRVRNQMPSNEISDKQECMLTNDAPFSTDKFLVWNKFDDEDRDQYLTKQAAKQRSMNRNVEPPPPLPIPEPALPPAKRLEKLPLGENDDPVSFSHLLSHGYQADWNKDNSETRKTKMATKRKDEKEQKEKLTRHLNEIKVGNGVHGEKPLFKLKKFANVSPKVVNS